MNVTDESAQQRASLEQERMLESLDAALAAYRAYRAGFFTEKQYQHLISEMGIRNYVEEKSHAKSR